MLKEAGDALTCKRHAIDGMVNVVSQLCRHGCTTLPSFNVEGGRRPAYCRRHAIDGMVNVVYERCRHGGCTVIPSFNVEGGRRPSYCKRHAEVGMVSVKSKRCSYTSCTKQPSWGVLAGGVATVCTEHMNSALDTSIVNFLPRCTIVGCPKVSTWGLVGRPPSHCHDHADLNDDIFSTVRPEPKKSIVYRSPSCAPESESFKVKTECSF